MSINIPLLQVSTSAIPLTPTTFTYSTVETTTALDFTTPENDYMYGVTYTSGNPSGSFGTAQPTANNKSASISIGLKHAFSQIKLIIKKGDTYQGTPEITNVTLSCKQPFLASSNASTMSLTNGSLSGLTTPGTGDTDYNVTYTYNLQDTHAVTIDGTSVTAFSIANYILPSTAGIPYKISITADGKTMELPGTTNLLEAGKINQYTISIHGTGLRLDGFTIVPWSPKDIEVTDKL